MRHRLQWRQPEPFVKRGKDEYFGRVVKNPQNFNWDEAQEANIILHCALDHCAPQIGMTGEVVSDDDQLQVFRFPLFFEFSFQR